MSGFLIGVCPAPSPESVPTLQRPLPHRQHPYPPGPTHHVIVVREGSLTDAHSSQVQDEGVPHARGPVV